MFVRKCFPLKTSTRLKSGGAGRTIFDGVGRLTILHAGETLTKATPLLYRLSALINI